MAGSRLTPTGESAGAPPGEASLRPRAVPARTARIRRSARAFGGSPAAAVAVAVVVASIVVAVAAPLIAPYNPDATNILQRLQGPSAAHWFGTDELGRDLLSRVIYGGRVSLLTAGIAVAGASVVGVTLGMVSGYFGGWAETLIMRVIDILLAIPAILLAMGLIAVIGRGTLNAAIAVTVVSAPAFARIARASTLSLRQSDFIASTRIAGASNRYLLARTILPNILNPIVVQMAITGATAILFESGLSFLGLGTQPPTPSWGQMLSDSETYLTQTPWYGVAPGLFLTVNVLALDVVSRFLQRVTGSKITGELSL